MKNGTYSDIIFSNNSNKKIDKILKYLNFKKDFNDNYHCTLIYSKKYLQYFKTSKGTKQVNGEAKSKLSKLIKIKGFGHFDTPEGKNLHMILDCPWCKVQFDRAMKCGAKYDYDEYVPHVTLMYNCTSKNSRFDISKVDMKEFIGVTLEIVEERISILNENWVEDSKNKKENK